jgi:uncharacterized protein
MAPAPMPAIAAFYAGLVGLLLIILALPMSALRHRLKMGLGDGGDSRLGHANNVEWALPTLILLALAELNRAPPVMLHVCGIALLVGHIVYSIGLSGPDGGSGRRYVGTALTWAALIVLSIWDIWAFARLALV